MGSIDFHGCLTSLSLGKKGERCREFRWSTNSAWTTCELIGIYLQYQLKKIEGLGRSRFERRYEMVHHMLN